MLAFRRFLMIQRKLNANSKPYKSLCAFGPLRTVGRLRQFAFG